MSTKYTIPTRPTIVTTSEMKTNIAELDKPLSHVTVKGTTNPDGRYFHFRLSMIHEKEITSIRLDMRPSYTDPTNYMRGVLLIEYKKYSVSSSQGTDEFSIQVRQGTTAAVILQILIDENNFDQYDFCDDGTGCRHWCARVLEIIAEKGLASANIGEHFRGYEADQARKFGVMFPIPRIKGSFY